MNKQNLREDSIIIAKYFVSSWYITDVSGGLVLIELAFGIPIMYRTSRIRYFP